MTWTQKMFMAGRVLPLTAGMLEKFTERNVAPGPALNTAAS